MSTQQPSQHAIVIGSGIAGLFAARILSSHFATVTVIERDELPLAAEARKGAPQARHLHVLLTRGHRILTQLFPGIEDDLKAGGASKVDWMLAARICSVYGWSQAQPSELISFACSRDLLEWVIRQRVQQIANIHFCHGRVAGVLTNEERNRVVGVRLDSRAANDQQVSAAEQEMPANLVVDASGRSSRLPDWLAALGYARPSENVINSKLGYASRLYQLPTNFQSDWQALLITAQAPSEKRGGVIARIENNQLMVTLSGYAGDTPPTDEAGFLAFAHSLRTPILADTIRQATPIVPISGYQRTENRWRRYDQLARLPEGIVALGDAVCAFNPVYGQGMTMSALGALELDALLQQAQGRLDQPGFALNFQRRLAKVSNVAWTLATGEDCRWPTTEGATPSIMQRFMHGYVGQLQQVTASDPQVTKTFWSVAHLILAPSALFHPRIIGKVVRHWLSQRLSQRPKQDLIGV